MEKVGFSFCISVNKSLNPWYEKVKWVIFQALETMLVQSISRGKWKWFPGEIFFLLTSSAFFLFHKREKHVSLQKFFFFFLLHWIVENETVESDFNFYFSQNKNQHENKIPQKILCTRMHAFCNKLYNNLQVLKNQNSPGYNWHIMTAYSHTIMHTYLT